jgi:hypothetical protein
MIAQAPCPVLSESGSKELRHLLQEPFEHLRSRWILELSNCLGFDLPNALACYFEDPADFFE